MENLENQEFVIIQDDEIYNKPTKAVPTPDRKKDIDLDGTLYDNIIAAGTNGVLDLNSFSSLTNTAQTRNELYNVYDNMCQDGTISAVVETYSEDATERNDDGKIVWAESDKAEVARMVEYFLDTLNVDKHIFKWVYSLCKYGDVYLRLYRESEYNDEIFSPTDEKQKKQLNEDVKIRAYSKNDNYAHYMEMVVNPAEMFEVTKFGKTVGYIQSPVNNTLQKKDILSLNQFQYKFKKEDVTIFPATEFVHASLEDNTTRSEEIINIFINQDDYDSEDNAHTYKVRRGQSVLADVFKVWRELNLLENAVLLYRVTKSSRVRMVNVEVGDMPKENVGKTLSGIKRLIEQKAAINSGNSMTEYNNAGPIENTIYVPTHGGIGTITTSEIGGDVDVKSLADLDYYTNKLYGQLRVPKQYFSQTDDSTGFNGGTSLSIISSRYAKMIKRIQNTMIQAITDAINLMLIDKGLDSYVNEFTIHMLPPTTQEEIDRRDSLSSKVGLATDIMNMLADIEDVSVRLKILKSLLSNIVSDSEIITELQDYIESLESELPPEEMPVEDGENMGMPGEEMGGEMPGGMEGPSGDLNADMLGGEEEGAEDAETESGGEDVLPSGDDLGVDLTDSDL
jgi:hypothetical protein